MIDEVRDSKLHLPESVEESLLDAVVAYLKETGEKNSLDVKRFDVSWQ